NPETKNLVDTFMRLSRSSYAEGLGALMAYEHQVPAVAQSKIDGLEKFYGINDERTLDFFRTHVKADEWHAQEVADLYNALSETEKKKADQAANQAADALWKFLDGVEQKRLAA